MNVFYVLLRLLWFRKMPMQEKSLQYLFWFFALTLLALPFFYIKTIVTQDGGVHLYNAFVLHDWTKNYDFYSQFYKINTAPSPNWLSEGLLAGLMAVFSPDIAEKIIQAICVLSLPFGLHYAITALRPEKGLWALLVVPLCYNFVFFYGFYNFCLSLPLGLFTIGYIWRKPEQVSLPYLIGLSLLFVLNYFTHPVAWLVVISVWFGSVLQAFFIQKNWLVFIKNCALLLPTLLLFATFAERNGLGFVANKLEMPLLKWFVLWQSGAAFDDKEKFSFALFGIVVTAFLFWFLLQKILVFYKKNKENNTKIDINTDFILIFIQKYTFFTVPIVFLLYLYLLVPDFTAGGGYLTVRVSYFLIFFTIIAISLLDNTAFAKSVMAVFAICTTLGIYSSRLPNMQKVSDFNTEMMQIAEKIPEKSVVLTLNYTMTGEVIPSFYPKMMLFKHIAARIGSTKPSVLLENYEANTNYFPLIWHQNCNPYQNMGEKNGIDNDPPTANIAEYEQVSGKKVTQIITLGQANSRKVHNNLSVSNTLKYVFDNFKNTTTKYNIALYQKTK
jgi:hypothetical protein